MISAAAALGVRTHFDRLAIAVALVFAGRFAVPAVPNAPPSRRARQRTEAGAGRASGAEAARVPITAIGVAFAVALPFLPISSRYLIDLGTTVLIYVMLGWGLNIVVGLAGLLDLGYVAFYAVGAYTFALLAQNFGFGFWEALPFSGVMAAAFGILLGFPVLRLRGDYLAIVTLGFGEIVRLVLLNWYNVTGGPNGAVGAAAELFRLAVRARPARRRHDLCRSVRDRVLARSSRHLSVLPDPGPGADHQFFHLAHPPAAGRPRLGGAARGRDRLPRARHQPDQRQALGLRDRRDVRRLRRLFFATRQGFISPESFTFIESATILAIVVLGGMGSQLGVVLAAFCW